MNPWQRGPEPLFILAPMDDVTDIVFRGVVERAAAPDIFMTEFVSTDGLCSAGRERTLERLRRDRDSSRPLIAQIWGANPDHYFRVARELAEAGWDAIDINLGCPEKGIVARGCCGGLIGKYDEVEAIIKATKKGAGDIPISVKTRLGLDRVITEDWAGFLLQQELDALTFHARTVREMSKVPARWDEIAKVVSMREKLGSKTLVIGNGDVRDRAHGLELAAETGVDGIMIGRGIFHNLFAFAETPPSPAPEQMITILLDHLQRYEDDGARKPFQVLKKFFKIYVNGWYGAADLRAQLMEATTPDEVRQVLADAAIPESQALTL